jgi:nicotinamide-nucleotide amidase
LVQQRVVPLEELQISTVPGSSQYFNGGIVCYHNKIKESILGVNPETLFKFGAVSEETVREMLIGACRVLDVDLAVAVSGIMGPGGGTETKPVGTVWIAVGSPQNMVTKKFQYRYDRERNTKMTQVAAVNELLKWLRV